MLQLPFSKVYKQTKETPIMSKLRASDDVTIVREHEFEKTL